MVIDSDKRAGDCLLKGESITETRGNRVLVDDVDIHLDRSELVGLIGPNGAGKSTLLSTLAGLKEPDTGQVMLHDKPIGQYAANQRAQQLGWLEQLSMAHWPVSVKHLVMLGRIPYLSRWQSPTDEDHQLVHEVMEATDCLSFQDQSVTTLSGGELTRVMLARALASEPSVLLADEPTAALDIGHQLQIMDLLKTFCTTERACIVVLHDLTLAARYCDRVYLMNDARVVASGLPMDVLNPDNVRSVYGVEIAVIGGQQPSLTALRRV
jgi:iron complex transport system ATP-binding protein